MYAMYGVSIEVKDDGEYRLVLFDKDEYGARAVHDIIEGDYRFVMSEAVKRLSPDANLVVRKKPKTRAELREEKERLNLLVENRARELSGIPPRRPKGGWIE